MRVTADDRSAAWIGHVTAVDSTVNETTRNIRIQATLDNPGGRLRPGMFVQAEVDLGPRQHVLALPASAISYAPYGDSVFVVADLKGPEGKTYRGVRQQVIKLGPARGDQIAVLSGLKAGEVVVSGGQIKLRNGTVVSVNNDVPANNDVHPTPPNE